MASPRPDASSASPRQLSAEFSAIRDELRVATQSLQRLQTRFDKAVDIFEEEITRRTRRIEELEADNADRRAKYAELMRKDKAILREMERLRAEPHAQCEANLRQARAERDKAQKERRQAQRALRDMLNNKESLASTSPRSHPANSPHPASAPPPAGTSARPARDPPPASAPTGASRLRPARDPPPASAPAGGPSSQPASGPAPASAPPPGPSARPARGEPPLSPTGMPMPEAFGQPPRRDSRAAHVSTVASDDEDGAAPAHDSGSDRTVDGPTDIYDDYTFDAGPPPEGEDEMANSWGFDIIPEVARVVCGGMTFERMCNRLRLDDGFVQALQQLEERIDYWPFRLHIRGNNIFVLDPIILESSSDSYLFTWMAPEQAAAMKETIWGKDVDRMAEPEVIRNTFVRVPAEDANTPWYYIGELRWSLVELTSQWPKYNRQIKQTLAEVLKDRWRSTLTPKDIAALIEKENTRFVQFSIRLRSDETLEERSRAVAQDVLRMRVRELNV